MAGLTIQRAPDAHSALSDDVGIKSLWKHPYAQVAPVRSGYHNLLPEDGWQYKKDIKKFLFLRYI